MTVDPNVTTWDQIVYGLAGVLVLIGAAWIGIRDTFHNEPVVRQKPDTAGHNPEDARA